MNERLLLCLTVDEDRSLASIAAASAARLGGHEVDVDVLVLDDCAEPTDAGTQLARRCHELGIGYYRSPRRLGTPRTVNLGIRAAQRASYGYVVVARADVILPANLIDQLLDAQRRTGAASVSAWSSSLGEYSLENSDPAMVADQDVVDWVSTTLATNFGDVVFDVPVGVALCTLLPVPVIQDVGLMDPVFESGHGYMTDWTLRARSHGHRVCLAPGAFVHRTGSPETRPPGSRRHDEIAAQQAHALVDLRYPQFAEQLVAFRSSNLVPDARQGATRSIVLAAAADFGYSIDVGWLPRRPDAPADVRCVVGPDVVSSIRMEYRGFRFDLPLETDEDPTSTLKAFFGAPPTQITLHDRGRVGTELSANAGSVQDRFVYPTRL